MIPLARVLTGLLLTSAILRAETQTATLGAGCFWCIESIFEAQDGVLEVVSGYAGGTVPNPTYEQVCSGKTGHAEVVQITYDPEKISYDRLLEIFWKTHDPTDGRGVAPDFGPQYRPIILWHDESQRLSAEASKAALAARLGKPVATEIVPLEKFYPAEDHHQNYVANNPRNPYVQGVAKPKLKKLGLDHVPHD